MPQWVCTFTTGWRRMSCAEKRRRCFRRNDHLGSDRMKRSARYACTRVSLESLRGQSRRRRDRPMTKPSYLGLDVHAATIAVALLEDGQDRPEVREIPNDPAVIRKTIKQLGKGRSLRC